MSWTRARVGLGHNLVKFQALERQNSVLVVASKPQLLRAAALWISRLDRSAVASTGVKVYRVKYGDAPQMAAMLSNIFTGGTSAGLKSPSNQIAPNSGATTLSTMDRLTGGPKQDAQNGTAAGGPGRQGAEAAGSHLDGGGARPAGERRRRRRSGLAAPRRAHHGRRGQQFDSRLRRRGALPESSSARSISSTAQDCKSLSMSRSPRSRSTTN